MEDFIHYLTYALVYIMGFIIISAVVFYFKNKDKNKDEERAAKRQMSNQTELLQTISKDIKNLAGEVNKIKECQKTSDIVIAKEAVDRCCEDGYVTVDDKADIVAMLDALANNGVNGRGKALRQIIEKLQIKN